MTVSTQTSRVEYAGDGSTTAFSIPFPYQAKAHIVATLINDSTEAETSWALTTNYTLTDPGATGTLTALVAPASGYTLRIERTVPRTQTLDLIANDAFPSTSVESTFDKLVMIDQQLQRQIDDIYSDPPSARAFLSGITAPSDDLGDDGDTYLDTVTGLTYVKDDGEWALDGGDLTGPQGPAGTTTVTGGITGDTSSTIGNIATWSNTAGTAVEDSGVAVSNVVLKTTAQTIAGAKTFSDAVVIDDAATITGTLTASGAMAVAGQAIFSGEILSAGGLVVYSEDAGASAGPEIDLYRDSASPADNDDLGYISFSGEDDGGGYEVYGQIDATALDVSAGSEDGQLTLSTDVAGVLTAQLALSTGVVVGAATGGAQGTGTVNSTGFYVNGTALSGGKLGQVVETTYTSANTVTATTPHDNTIPQVGEGTQILSRTITPANASSTLLIDVEVPIYVSALGASGAAEEVTAIVHLHKDGASNASWAALGPRVKGFDTDLVAGSNTMVAHETVRFRFLVTSGGTSLQTWTVRVGKAEIVSGGTGVVTVNGTATLGAVRGARITISEILP